MKRHLIRSYLPALSIAASFLLAGCYTQLAVQGEYEPPPDVGAVEPPPPLYGPVLVPEPAPPILIIATPSSGSSGETKESPYPQRASGVRRSGNSDAPPNASDGGTRTDRTGRSSAGNSNVGDSLPLSPVSTPRTDVVRSPNVPSGPPPASVGSPSGSSGETSGSSRSNGASRSGR